MFFCARLGLAAAFAILGFNNASAAPDRELGKHLSEQCVTCHRPAASAGAGVPQIVGLPEDQFVALMNTYRDKVRDNPVMQTVASALSADDIASLAAYFGSLKPPSAAKAKGKK